MFLDINKELPTADTRCRWVSPRTRWCDCIVASGLSPVNAMGSNAPAPWTPTITIKTTDDAIKFFELLRDACNQRRIAWWMHDALQEFPSPEARVAAARALEKAMRIDLLMDQNLNVALAPQGGVRLNMDTADETPAREGDAPRAPTTTPSPGLKVLLPHGTYSLNTIEAWVQVAITTALGDGSAILKGASQDPRPGTASLRVVQNIFAPRTTQAASAARKALDDIIKGFAKDCGLHEHITRALNAALVCQYYQPSTDWDSHLITETVHKINDEYGPEHALTLTVSRLLDTPGFMADAKRFEKFHAALVQHEHTYKVFRTDPQITTIRAVTPQSLQTLAADVVAGAEGTRAGAVGDAAAEPLAAANEQASPAPGAPRTLARSTDTMSLTARIKTSPSSSPTCAPRASSKTGAHRHPQPRPVTQSAWCASIQATLPPHAGTSRASRGSSSDTRLSSPLPRPTLCPRPPQTEVRYAICFSATPHLLHAFFATRSAPTVLTHSSRYSLSASADRAATVTKAPTRRL